MIVFVMLAISLVFFMTVVNGALTEVGEVFDIVAEILEES